MQTLGPSESTPRSESRARTLLWPTIRNATDLDYVTQQGFWVCFVVALMTLLFSVSMGTVLGGVLEGVYFFLAGVGVRQRSRVAGLAAFSSYFLSALVMQRYTGNGFGVIRIIFLALLFANVRGNWLAAKWKQAPEDDPIPIRLNETLSDKLVDSMPAAVWPKARFVFYAVACVEILFLLFPLFAPARS